MNEPQRKRTSGSAGFLLSGAVLMIVAGCGSGTDGPVLTPAINLSAASQTFSSYEGGPNPTAQVIQLTNSGQGPLNWTTSADQPWIKITATSGDTTAETDTLSVSVDITGLAAGSYSSIVTVQDPAASNNPQTVLVTLNLDSPPSIGLAATNLSFTSYEGGPNPTAQNIQLTNSGQGPLNWTTSADQPWITVTPTSGDTTAETDTLSVSVDITGLPAGTYSGNVTVKDPAASNSPQTIAVTLSVFTPKGSRVIAMDVNEGQSGDYDAATQIAINAGMEITGLFLQWDVLEPSPGVYDNSLLSIIELYYPSVGLKVDPTIAVINATVKTVPSDLQSVPFDDPVMIARFLKLLDFVHGELPTVELHSINIGSEMDIYFGTDSAQWSRFKTFYDAALSHLKTLRPGINVTVEPTYDGIMGPAKKDIHALNQNSDAIGVSYYPMESNGDVSDPSVVQSHFDAITAEYPSRPIYFHQFGYPSSTLLNSSEAKQAEFIRQTFLAWDSHATQIEKIDFTWLHDLNPTDVDAIMTFYGFSTPKFAEFLGTLGLRTWPNQDKLGFQALLAEAAARGW